MRRFLSLCEALKIPHFLPLAIPKKCVTAAADKRTRMRPVLTNYRLLYI